MTRRLVVLSTSLGVWALVLAAPSAAQASSILFTNFGGGLSYNTGVGNPVGNDFFGDTVAQGDSFKPLVTDSVDLVRIALSDFSFATNVAPITVDLTADAGGLPGAVLESWTIPAGTLGMLGLNNSPVVLSSLLHPTLSTANTYWLTAAMTSVDDPVAWNLNSTGDVHHTASSDDGGATWFSSPDTDLTPGAFDVEGPSTAPVPEPGTLTLLATGVALAGRRWRTFRART